MPGTDLANPFAYAMLCPVRTSRMSFCLSAEEVLLEAVGKAGLDKEVSTTLFATSVPDIA
eukprot:1673002-Rhodomonas_salina.1